MAFASKQDKLVVSLTIVHSLKIYGDPLAHVLQNRQLF